MTAKSLILPLLQSKIRHKQALTLPSVNAGKNPHPHIKKTPHGPLRAALPAPSGLGRLVGIGMA